MKIVIAVDSFKGSMTSLEAGNAIKAGIELGFAGADICGEISDSLQDNDIMVIPVADGGEGTLEALSYGKNIKTVRANVTGPLGTNVLASYVQADENTALIEIAEAAGLTLVPEGLRNPLETTTYGIGELIRHAINKGCRKFIIALGGSATNDCGIGMLQALGYSFLDKDLKEVGYGAKALKNVRYIKCEAAMPQLRKCDFEIICDVDNPLVKERGCSRIFAPQKGATPDMVEKMDLWMDNFADMVEKKACHITDVTSINKQDSICEKNIYTSTPDYNRFTQGAGAAGGLGYAFLMFLNAKLLPGAELVIRETGLEEYIKESDAVIVGEGKLDRQSTMGKIPYAIAKTAKKHGKKVIAFAGMTEDEENLYSTGMFDKIYAIKRNGMSIEEGMKTENAVLNLRNTVCREIENALLE